MISVSGYQVDKLFEMADQRLYTILIGGATCIFISIFVCPVWSGGDLHNLIASNLDKLANYLQGITLVIHTFLHTHINVYIKVAKETQINQLISQVLETNISKFPRVKGVFRPLRTTSHFFKDIRVFSLQKTLKSPW